MNDVLRGVLFSLVGNIAISLGDHLKLFGDQEKSNGKKLYHGKTKKKINLIYSRRFFFGLLGYIVMVTGQICNGYALAFAPQTLLACIGSIQFIVNLLCCVILLSRPIKSIHIIGTLSIIVGCLIMIFGFSPKTDQSQLTVYTLFYNFNSIHYRNYLLVVVFIFLLNIVWQYFESNYLNFNHLKDKLHKKRTVRTTQSPHSHSSHPSHPSRNNKNKNKKNKNCKCVDPKLISGFFYSFSSAMAGTQSVVLGKTLAIIIRNYADGKIVIFKPLDLFILFFIIIVFICFVITFAFWLYRRTESMVLFDTVFIAPMNQVMWLTFSTVAGGIYFHEFESANALQWIALIAGMLFNYVGLYYLVPTASDQPILIINMEKPLKKKVDDYDNDDDDDNDSTHTHTHTHTPKRTATETTKEGSNSGKKIKNKSKQFWEKMSIKDKIKIKRNHQRKCVKTKTLIKKWNYFDDGIIDNDNEHETDESDGDNYEHIPLLNRNKDITITPNNHKKWYQFFGTKRR